MHEFNKPDEEIIGYVVLVYGETKRKDRKSKVFSTGQYSLRTGQYPHRTSKLYKTKGSAKAAAKCAGYDDFEVVACFMKYAEGKYIV